jgi:hypothetical protein
MKKICVFCGELPVEKTREHVIPQWLIEYTGNPSRNASFGIDIDYELKTSKHRKFAFNDFHFPACSKCNHAFSILENKTQDIITKITSNERISLNIDEINVMLDWFDKVRVGLWLGSLYLDKDEIEGYCNYFISRRIRAHDRMLAIYKSNFTNQRLNFTSTSLPLFKWNPAVISMNVNNTTFFNCSWNFLFSRRIGFPYPEKIYRGVNEVELIQGTGRMHYPLIRKPLLRPCVEIYQPILPEPFNDIAEYKTDYLKNNCLDYKKGIGKIFVQKKDKIIPILTKLETNFEKIFDSRFLDKEISKQTLALQIYLYEYFPLSLEKLPPEEQKKTKKCTEIGIKINKMLIRRIDRKM